MSDVEIKQTLVNWNLVHLCDKSMRTLELVIWAEPQGEPSRYVVTSPVREIVAEDGEASALVYTANSVYRVGGQGAQYSLPLEAITMLRQGHSPDEVTKFYRFRSERPKRELTGAEKAAGIKIPGAPLIPEGLGRK